MRKPGDQKSISWLNKHLSKYAKSSKVIVSSQGISKISSQLNNTFDFRYFTTKTVKAICRSTIIGVSVSADKSFQAMSSEWEIKETYLDGLILPNVPFSFGFKS